MSKGAVLLFDVLLDDGQRRPATGRGKVARAPKHVFVIPVRNGWHALPEQPRRNTLQAVDQFGKLNLGLAVRQWTCSVCQAAHDRDANAAKNILARGLLELEREFSTAGEAKAVEAAVNEDGKPSQVGHDLPAVGIIAPLGR